MDLNRGHETDHKIQDAILFFVEVFEREKRNPKPVLFHSLRVAFKLYELDYNSDVVIAAIFHDALEDMKITYDEIEDHFGKTIARLVQANTFDESLPTKENIFLDSLTRAEQLGENALVIRGSDLLDNSYYYHFSQTPANEKALWDKVRIFLDRTHRLFSDNQIWKELNNKYQNNK